MAGKYWYERPVLGWAAYDWANSAFSLTVVTAFVPVLLAQYWNDGADSTVTTFRLGMANGLASLIVAISAPVLGAIADQNGRRECRARGLAAEHDGPQIGVAQRAVKEQRKHEAGFIPRISDKDP